MQNQLSILLISVGLFFSFFAHAGRPIRGTYEVPVADSLKEYASYPVKFKADNYQSNPNTISFPMPGSLLGEQTFITMSKVEGTSTEWSGSNVTGNCETIGRFFKCVVRFSDLAIDQSKVESVIRQEYATSEEIDGRMQVARVFDAEPIGILIYKMRGRSSDD